MQEFFKKHGETVFAATVLIVSMVIAGWFSFAAYTASQQPVFPDCFTNDTQDGVYLHCNSTPGQLFDVYRDDEIIGSYDSHMGVLLIKNIGDDGIRVINKTEELYVVSTEIDKPVV